MAENYINIEIRNDFNQIFGIISYKECIYPSGVKPGTTYAWQGNA